VTPTLRRAFFAALERLGRDEALAREMRRTGRIAVLNFHRVSPAPHPYANPLDPALFDEVCAFVARRCRVATPSDDLGGIDDPRPAVVLSFDDGCLDFVEHAAPILAKHRLVANHNVVGACVASGRPMWNLLLYDFLLAAPASLLSELRVPGVDVPPVGGDDADRTRYALRLGRRLKTRPRAERAELWAPFESAMARLGEFPVTPMMRLDDVRGAAAAGHEIGCHSWSHESMGFEDDAFFADDLARCDRLFREELRLPLDVYAFPNGSWRRSQIETLLARGVRRVLLVDEDYARAADATWPRFTMYGASAPELRLRALGWRARRGR
jgi:peptidoglycan/xylan/chitin deacetylase (PgdA/CDA1 family)